MGNILSEQEKQDHSHELHPKTGLKYREPTSEHVKTSPKLDDSLTSFPQEENDTTNSNAKSSKIQQQEQFKLKQECNENHSQDLFLPSSDSDDEKTSRNSSKISSPFSKISAAEKVKVFHRTVKDKKWLNRYKQLEEFRKKHGHTNVPIKYEPNPALGLWVGAQKTSYKAGALSTDRCEKLTKLGFEWDARTCNLEVGCRLSVYWPDDDEYYNCVITSKEGPTTFALLYDDDEKETVDLQKEEFKLLSFPDKKKTRKRKMMDKSDDDDGDGDDGDGDDGDGDGDHNVDQEEEVQMKKRTHHDEKWHNRYKQLEQYHKKYGHCNVPNKQFERNSFGSWVNCQRIMYKKMLNGKPHTLTPQRAQLLNKVGFQRSVYLYDERWILRYKELEEFKRQYGHCNVSNGQEGHEQIGRWVNAQRKSYRLYQIPLERVQLLEKIGFQWIHDGRLGLSLKTWQEKYNELAEFKLRHGHCNVPKSYTQNQELGLWVKCQKELYRSYGITSTRMKQLEKIGFKGGGSRNEEWEKRYAKNNVQRTKNTLSAVIADATDEICDDSKTSIPSDDKLKVSDQTTENTSSAVIAETQGEICDDSKISILSDDKLEASDQTTENTSSAVITDATDEICDDSNVSITSEDKLEVIAKEDKLKMHFEEKWLQRYNQLEDFKNTHGHCDVPSHFKKNQKLANWVLTQRRDYKCIKYPMAKERVEKLEKLGFKWKIDSKPDESRKRWFKRYDELVKYKQKFGHCNVSQSHHPYEKLGVWVFNQRIYYHTLITGKPSCMTLERAQCLDALGIEWDMTKKTWEEYFDDLVEFKRRNGHFNISSPNTKKNYLGIWIGKQRRYYKYMMEGQLSPLTKERAKKLDQIGFPWEAKKSRERTL